MSINPAQDMQATIPVLSLIVAALAVFVGPLISWWIAKRQIESSLVATNKQIVAPMRQAWINNLRDLLSEVLASALHYYVAGFEDRRDEEYQRLTFLEQKVSLMLNANEDDHKELEAAIRRMIGLIQPKSYAEHAFPEAHEKVVSLSRGVLKREWDRVKEPLSPLSKV